MSWKHFNTEPKHLKSADICQQNWNASMRRKDEDTWYNEIRRPGKDYAVRVNKFLDGRWQF